MKKLISLLFVGFATNGQAGILEEWIPTYTLTSSTIDSSLNTDQAMYSFTFLVLDGSSETIAYSIDGINYSVPFTENTIDVRTTPGAHIFQFFYSANYYEVYTDSLPIGPKSHATYEIRMDLADRMIISDKPVIYLYPEKETNVEVKVNVTGEGTFYYPSYSDSWRFIASPSGDLTFGKDVYNYLFWEGVQMRKFTSNEMNEGFVVKKANVIAFLEEKLTAAGLNSKEQADFITYWGPRLAQNELNFIHFEFNEECNRYAELNINPTPDEIYRIYILWMPISHERSVTEQQIPSYSRDGFSILEWGGIEISREHRIAME